MAVVSNSSPIIHLAKIHRLHLLESLYRQIFVPERVFKECTVASSYRQELYTITQADWLKRKEIQNHRLFKLLNAELDAGEAEALVLTLEYGADLVLLDDQEARAKARKLELQVTGTLGVLLKAKNNGLIHSLNDDLHNLEQSGFWLSSDIKAKILS